jgi:putative transposase
MERKPYPTDVTDSQWRRLEPLVPQPKHGGRPAKCSRREIVNALFYQTANGCTWRSLPHDLPPYRMVFRYFRLWQQDGTLDRIHDALRGDVRRQAGRKPKPKVAILDSQTVKTTENGGPRGYDAGKKNHRPQTLPRRRFAGPGVGVDDPPGPRAGSGRRRGPGEATA